MQIAWTARAMRDLHRVTDFIGSKNPAAALAAHRQIVTATRELSEAPRIGSLKATTQQNEIRCRYVGDYEIRYRVTGEHIVIARIWHTREQRPS